MNYHNPVNREEIFNVNQEYVIKSMLAFWWKMHQTFWQSSPPILIRKNITKDEGSINK